MQTISSGERSKPKATFVSREKGVAARKSGVSSASFHSILFESPESGILGDKIEPPDFFRDLNLDRIADAITTETSFGADLYQEIFGGASEDRSDAPSIQEDKL